MRIPFIAGNWKMFKTAHEAVVFVKELRLLVKDVSGVDIIVAPAFVAVQPVAEALRSSNIAVAAQNLHWEREGAFTGEVSAPMIKDAGAEYVIVGHSERRRLFGETDATVNRKIGAAIAASVTPIVCVGETLEEREAGKTEKVVGLQLDEVLATLSPEEAARIVLAYEPVWAIGTGKSATSQQAQDVHAFLRARLVAKGAADVALLYGGSVKPENAEELFRQPDIDGGLIGGASLKDQDFLAICKAAGAVSVTQ
jgi:triosephosphate isomerase